MRLPRKHLVLTPLKSMDLPSLGGSLNGLVRAHALVVVLALLLAKVAQRRLKKAAVEAPTVAAMLEQLQGVSRVTLHYGSDAPPALRALAEGRWVPSVRSALQQAMLQALGVDDRSELGTTLGVTSAGRSALK
jgi:hypothetical protein